MEDHPPNPSQLTETTPSPDGNSEHLMVPSLKLERSPEVPLLYEEEADPAAAEEADAGAAEEVDAAAPVEEVTTAWAEAVGAVSPAPTVTVLVTTALFSCL